jgi:protein TonB
MFDHLVESSSNKDDIARKGSFIGMTILVYGVVLIAFVIGSIYMIDATMENQNLELEALVAPVPVPEKQPDKPKEQPKEQPKENNQDTRTELQNDVNTSTKVPPAVSTNQNNIPPATKASKIGSSNNEVPPPTGPVGPSDGGGGPAGPVVADDDAPPPPKPTPAPPKTIVSGGVLNGKALRLPVPVYPAPAKAAHASGAVNVQVTIDENGGVISATAVSGPVLLRAAAVQAARGARFSPTKLSGVPVKVTGTIIYNFTAQ